MSKANNIASLLNSSGLLDSDDIATSAITNSKIASGAIDSDAIGTDAITAAKLNIGQIGGRRNLIINGAMQVAQRGTSATGAGVPVGTYETADRWKFLVATGTTLNSYQRAFTPGQTDVPGEPEFYLESDVTASSGASTYYVLAQHIEDVRSFAGQTATLSFWARHSVGGKKVGIEFSQNFDSGNGGSTRTTSVARDSVTLSTSWQKFSVTVDIPSISGKTIGTTSSSYLELYLWCSAGSDFDFRSSSTPEQTGKFDFALIQLELGDTATPFEHRSFGEELALCQRYYYDKLFYGSTATNAFSTNSYGTYVTLPVTMRSTPAVSRNTDYNFTDYPSGTNNSTNLNFQAVDSNSVRVWYTGSTIVNYLEGYITLYAEI